MPKFSSRLFAPLSRFFFVLLVFFSEYVICFDNFMTLQLLAVPDVGYFWLFTHELKGKTNWHLLIVLGIAI